MSTLTENQKKILAFIANDEMLCGSFYLTGGTALAEYYLRHRLSEDLDFFAEKEFEPQAISAFFKKIEVEAGIRVQKEKKWALDELAKKAQVKFDHFLDPLQLAAQFTKVETFKDYPRMLTPVPEREWQSFFLNEAKRIGKTQIE